MKGEIRLRQMTLPILNRWRFMLALLVNSLGS